MRFINCIFFYLLLIIAETSAKSNLSTVDVRSFGAKGDGQFDNTAAFNAASAAGGNIYIPKGNFKISGQVTTVHNYTNWTSDPSAVIHFTSTTTVGFLIVNDHCTFHGLHITGSGTSANSIVKGTVIFVQGADYTEISQCSILGAGGNSIELQAGVSKNYPFVRGCSHNTIVKNNILFPAGTLPNNTGIMIGFAETHQFNYNNISENYINGRHVLHMGIMQLSVGHGNVYNKNRIFSLNSYGIALYAPDAAKYGALTGNSITNNYIHSIGILSSNTRYGSGIYLQSALNSVVTANTIIKAGIHADFSSLPMAGIAINLSSGSVVRYNRIDSCLDVPGINVANNFAGGKLSNNTIKHCYHGIQAQASNRIQITNNILNSIRHMGVNIKSDTDNYKARPAEYRGMKTGIDYDIRSNTINCREQAINMFGKTYDALSNINILHNKIRSDYVNGALALAYIKDYVVQYNTINQSSGGYAIAVNGDTENGDISFNSCKSTRPYLTAISVSGPVKNIKGNSIGAATHQLSVNGAFLDHREMITNGVLVH